MDHKEKYEQALERARVYHTGGSISDAHITEVIFPELKESDDERIRKGLVKAVSGILKGNTLYGTDVTREEALAWLEKQGEQKPTEDVKTLDADKVIEWLYVNVADFWANPCNPQKVINQFKKDFGL